MLDALASLKCSKKCYIMYKSLVITVENRGNEHTWRMPANLISAILYADRGDRAKIGIAALGIPGDFRRSRRSANKIAKCVAGFTAIRRVDTWPANISASIMVRQKSMVKTL